MACIFSTYQFIDYHKMNVIRMRKEGIKGKKKR